MTHPETLKLTVGSVPWVLPQWDTRHLICTPKYVRRSLSNSHGGQYSAGDHVGEAQCGPWRLQWALSSLLDSMCGGVCGPWDSSHLGRTGQRTLSYVISVLPGVCPPIGFKLACSVPIP